VPVTYFRDVCNVSCWLFSTTISSWQNVINWPFCADSTLSTNQSINNFYLLAFIVEQKTIDISVTDLYTHVHWYIRLSCRFWDYRKLYLCNARDSHQWRHFIRFGAVLVGKWRWGILNKWIKDCWCHLWNCWFLDKSSSFQCHTTAVWN